jgi:hypothetical protein
MSISKVQECSVVIHERLLACDILDDVINGLVDDLELHLQGFDKFLDLPDTGKDAFDGIVIAIIHAEDVIDALMREQVALQLLARLRLHFQKDLCAHSKAELAEIQEHSEFVHEGLFVAADLVEDRAYRDSCLAAYRCQVCATVLAQMVQNFRITHFHFVPPKLLMRNVRVVYLLITVFILILLRSKYICCFIFYMVLSAFPDDLPVYSPRAE